MKIRLNFGPGTRPCLSARQTNAAPRPVHKLNKNSMTATTTATDRGPPPTRRGGGPLNTRGVRPHPPPPDEVRRLRPGQKEREAVRKQQNAGRRRELVGLGQVPDHRMRSYKKKSKRRMKKGEELLLRMDPMEGRGKEGKTQARKRYYGCKVCNDLRGC